MMEEEEKHFLDLIDILWLSNDFRIVLFSVLLLLLLDQAD